MLIGFIQSFTYAEIAGLFPNKSGGASVYGAAAWLHYGKFIAPLSVWCNWLAWTPVLSLGCAIAAGYILNADRADAGRERIAATSRPSAVAGNGGRSAAADARRSRRSTAGRCSTFRSAGRVALVQLRPSSSARSSCCWSSPFSIAGSLATARVQTVVGLVIVHHAARSSASCRSSTASSTAENFSPFVPLAAPYAPSTWRLEHSRLDAGARRHVHRGLVDLRLRDRDLLHQRVQESEDRHLQGHLLLRPALPRAVHPRAVHLPGLLGLDRHAAPAHRRRHRRRRGHGRHGRRRSAVIKHPVRDPDGRSRCSSSS